VKESPESPGARAAAAECQLLGVLALVVRDNRFMKALELQEILYSQGFGTRRVCAGLVQQGHVRVDGALQSDAGGLFQPDGLHFTVQGTPWTYHERAYVMLHKPAGTECSQKPSTWPSVYTLLPAPLRQRPQKGPVQGVQAVGRLDQDTTGLLLLTDDGAFIHRMNSPRHHVPKIYEVSVKHDIGVEQVDKLLSGVVLDDDPAPVRAAACEAVAPRHLRLTLTEGKYHQVKRMVAAVGNRVEALHRSQVGSLVLPDDLPPGGWRWLSEAEVEQLRAPQPKAA
jgi:16S rRNA pseudouridine516 synthase